ncbi:MAG: tRNA methyltransferase [Hyphomicrobiales bacterium]|nr:MAG: tRNA methyltransferase [Hyphomicrobiales bacterium]
MPDLVLFQPDIPGNTGTLLRLTACLGVKLHIIEPAGFRLDDTALRRSGMDYIELASMTRHLDWAAFEAWRAEQGRRLILLTTKTKRSYLGFEFLPDDLLMLGRESAGVSDEVAETADHAITIPMKGEARSINMALSGAMVLGEALRQSGEI